MSVAGVIVEFNPFHNGHAVHLKETREKTGCKQIIAVMSGNFVQRGEPAICDKWRRTKMALLAGVDIVIELPLPYVIGGADYFARGSVGLLAATNIVDVLSFGSESGDLNALKAAGQVLAEEPLLYKEILCDSLEKGLSFAAARGAALEVCLPNVPDGLLTKPNNGLAMEYCKAVYQLGDKIQLFTTHREKGGVSATKIRRALVAGEPVAGQLPDFVLGIIRDACKVVILDSYSDIFKYALYSMESDFGEGLENRFRRLCGEYSLISEILNAVKTKRYTYTRLQRLVISLILGIGRADMEMYDKLNTPPYIRVLGFRRESAGLLGRMVKKATLPVITTGAGLDEILKSDTVAGKMLNKELMAGDIYRLASGETGGYRSERGMGLVIV